MNWRGHRNHESPKKLEKRTTPHQSISVAMAYTKHGTYLLLFLSISLFVVVSSLAMRCFHMMYAREKGCQSNGSLPPPSLCDENLSDCFWHSTFQSNTMYPCPLPNAYGSLISRRILYIIIAGHLLNENENKRILINDFHQFSHFRSTLNYCQSIICWRWR